VGRLCAEVSPSRTDRDSHGTQARAVPLLEGLVLEQLERVRPHLGDLLNPPQPHFERGLGPLLVVGRGGPYDQRQRR
jgi:hypothetical protein